MKKLFSAVSEHIDINHIRSSLREGKWLYDENVRQRLAETVKYNEEPLMKQIMTDIETKSVSVLGAFSLDQLKYMAFLDLAALGGIGADWFLEKFNNDVVFNHAIDAISRHKSSSFAASLLLIELSRLTNTKDNLPHILEAAKYDDNKYSGRGGILLQWFFARLWLFIDDARVVDYLIGTLDKAQLVTKPQEDMWTPLPTTFDPSLTIIARFVKDIDCHPPEEPDAEPGAGYYARELLLLHGEERGIAALVKHGVWTSLIVSAKDLLTGQTKPKKMFENIKTNGGQFALLSKYLVEELETPKTPKYWQTIFHITLSHLAALGDKDAVNTVVIPKLFETLAAQRQGFLYESVSQTEYALNQLESCWTTAPFLGALEHRDGRVRLLAVKSLEKIGDSSTITAITPLLKDNDRKVQKAAKKAVSTLQR